MAGVDLSVFRFDYDLTFVALLMNADGTIYHTYGGRDASGPVSQLSMAGFTRVLKETLAEHERYREDPQPPARKKPFTIERIPPMAAKIKKGKGPDCFHCHMVHDAQQQDLKRRKRWSLDDAWVWPDPVQIGLTLDTREHVEVAAVADGSPAAAAGLAAGDRIVGAGAQRTLTFGDVQRVLHAAPGGRTRVRFEWVRGAESFANDVRLPAGWKAATPETFAWRPMKWGLSPKPGFGGKQLTARELAAAGLPEGSSAFRVGYIVTWGENRHTGQNAARAGIRKGDLVVSVAGKDDFLSQDHFHAWFRLTRKAGEVVPIEILRNGERRTVKMKVVD